MSFKPHNKRCFAFNKQIFLYVCVASRSRWNVWVECIGEMYGWNVRAECMNGMYELNEGKE